MSRSETEAVSVMLPRWSTEAEVCARYRMHRATLWRHIGAGVFPKPFKTGGRNKWMDQSLLDYERDLIKAAS